MGTRDLSLLALCLWREARGESIEARRAVLHVILNRMAARNEAAAQVILAPKQFSSFNANDPNALKFPMPDDHEWFECCCIVDHPGDDITGGASNYESCAPDHLPSWADPAKQTATVGAFRFYRL